METGLDPRAVVERLVPAGPVISPNGRHVAMTVAALSRAGERWDRQIWVSTDGAPAVRFSGGTGNHTGLSWHPESTALLFAAQREEDKDFRLYTLPINGGEARQLGRVAGEISQPRWSPDGTAVAFLLVDKDSDEVKKRKEEEKIDQVIFEEDDHLTRIHVLDAATGESRCLTGDDRHVVDVAWSDTGDELIAITTRIPGANELFRAVFLDVIPVDGSDPQRLATFQTCPETPVVRTVDGERRVYLVATDHRADPSPSLWMIPLAGGKLSRVVSNDDSTTLAAIADPRDTTGVIIQRYDHVHGRHYRFDATTGELRPLPVGHLADRGSLTSVPSMALSGDIAVVWTALDRVQDVYRVSPGGTVTRLTSFGDGINEQLAPGEVVRWTARDGIEIEGLLVYPKGGAAACPAPLVVEVHGGPASLWSDRVYLSWHDWAQSLAQVGIATLLPNPRGSIGFGTRFEKLLQDDVGFGEAHDLIDGALAMVERGIADKARLGIAGWSWGGYLTARVSSISDRFRAAIVGAGVSNNASDHGAGDIAAYNSLIYPDTPYNERGWEDYATAAPVRHADKVTAATLILHGENDVRVHISQGQEWYRALQQNGKEVRFVRYPREGHGFQERAHQADLLQRVVDWMRSHLSVSSRTNDSVE